MAPSSGRHELTAENGRLLLRTFRDGLAARAGHDLTIEMPRWRGELVVNDDGTPAAIAVRVEVGALVVCDGKGGLKPLTDADRREIASIARRLLAADRHPEAEFAATRFEVAGDEGTMNGTFTLRGIARPLRLRVRRTGPGQFRATGTVLQSAHGIKPYSGFMGALKVRDAVEVEVEVKAPSLAGAG